MIRNKVVSTMAAAAMATGFVLAGCGGGQKTETAAPKQKAAAVTQTTVAYPLDWCLVSGEELGEMGDPVVRKYQGRELKFCCDMCVKTFEADPSAYIARLDSAAAGLIERPSEAEEGDGEHEGDDHGA